MPKYRVIAFGGMDGLLFPDLLVKYTSGLQFPLQIKQGEYIPLEIFDPSDIQKSLIVGSLGKFIKSGDVLVEYSDAERPKKRKPRKPKNQPIQQVIPSVEEPKSAPEPQQKPEETGSVQQTKYIDLKDIKTVDDFFKASYFNRLKYIQICTDKTVLTELHKKQLPEEMLAHIELRLQAL